MGVVAELVPESRSTVRTESLGPLEPVSALAVAFVVARIAYAAFYWADVHLLRSLSWAAGFIASLGLMSLALV